MNNLLNNLFDKKKLTKKIVIYISEKYNQIIITPRHQNLAGIIFEQEKCFVSDYPMNTSELGIEVINQLNLFSINNKNLRDTKISDWPSYKHSKAQSINEFESSYINILVESVNDSN